MDRLVNPERITSETAFFQTYALPAELEQALTVSGKQQFMESYTAIRDRIEDVYFLEADKSGSPGERTRKFMGSMINPLIGRPVKDAAHFYQTYGRLMRHAWLSISLGIYNDEIQSISDIQKRLNMAQVNTIDLNWRPALHHLANQPDGLIVEVGTGRANSVVRLAQLLPHIKIISITISEEQHAISSRLVRELELSNVEIRLGDIFDRSVSNDLIGKADAVGAIEVTGHFPTEQKIEGITIFASLLKPGGVLSMMDTAHVRPPSNFARNYYANQSWYFGSQEIYEKAFDRAHVTLTAQMDYTASMIQSFSESSPVLALHRDKLRQEFGPLLAAFWPLVPRLNVNTLGNAAYWHLVGYKD